MNTRTLSSALRGWQLVFLIAVLPAFAFAQPCDDIDGGQIGPDTAYCGSVDVDAIGSLIDASTPDTIGVEYMWLYSDTLVPNIMGNPYWQPIANSNSATYDPGVLTETTYFIRCSRRLDCTQFYGESNTVTIAIHPAVAIAATSTAVSCQGLADSMTVCTVTRYNGNNHALWLPNVGASSSDFIFVNNSGRLEQYNNGTAHLTGRVENVNEPNKRWVVDVWFRDGMDWASWSALGRSYKDEANVVGTNYLNWTYYIMDDNQANTLVGEGDYAGDMLNLTHRPSNYNFGLQVGLAANSKDTDYGFSCWFNHTGSYSGHGDFNTDIACTITTACDGTAMAQASGGTAPFSYEWSNGSFGTSQAGLCADTLTVTVTDANGCQASAQVVIGSAPCCNVTDAGQIGDDQEGCGPFDPATLYSIAPASGGVGPVEYLWLQSDTNAANTQGNPYWMIIPGATSDSYDPGVITETTYFIRCSRNAGCSNYVGESNVVTITVHPLPLLAGAVTDALCNGQCDGAIDVTTTDGTAPYTSAWSNGATTEDLSGLCAGSYTLTVSDAKGCTATETYQINEPGNLQATVSATDATCQGNCDGSVSASATGGTAPYSFAWSNGASGATASGLCAGSYDVTITDANGCSTLSTVVVNEPSLLTGSVSTTDASCAGTCDGSASASASGGVAPYTYLWSTGGNTATETGLCAGSCSVTITDAHGCVTVTTFTINEPGALQGSATSTDASCHGTCDGTANASATGGTAPYTFAWDNGDTQAATTGLCAGSYSVTITDANGCVVVTSITVAEPTLLTASGTTSDASCAGVCDGSATVSANGGIAPYAYVWTSGGTGATETGLCAGTHDVTVTDANGCVTVVSLTVNEPSALQASASSVDATCHGTCDGSALVNATGGTAPYTYAWSSGSVAAAETGLCAGSYSVTVTDANGCATVANVTVGEPIVLSAVVTTTDASCASNCDGSASVSASGGTAPYTYVWSSGGNTATENGLCAGSYNVTATDANGCVTVLSLTINEPAPLQATINSSDVSCNANCDGSATVTIAGGTAPYSIAWGHGDTQANTTGLCAGTYNVTITDANNCTAVASVTISEPGVLGTSITHTNISCFNACDGSMLASATGGTAPYTFEWIVSGYGLGDPFNPSQSNLCPSNFVVQVTDANGCTATTGTSIVEPAPLTLNVLGSDATCGDLCDGTMEAVVTGGTMPYTYSWTDGSTTSLVNGVCADEYDVTVTDARGCTIDGTIEIEEPDALELEVVMAEIPCHGACKAWIDLTVVGGEAPYQYAWSNGATTEDLTKICAGSYTVTVMDANGCDITQTFVLSEPAPFSVSFVSSDATCSNSCDGFGEATPSGGVPPYSYSWFGYSPIVDDSVQVALCGGVYNVLAQDANGCSVWTDVDIYAPDPIKVKFVITDASCNAACDGEIQSLVSGGTLPYQYLWNGQAGGPLADSLCQGDYTLDIIDANGCTASKSDSITEPTPLSMSVSATASPMPCQNQGIVQGQGGVGPYDIFWSGINSLGEIQISLCDGSYAVTATDANGCEADTCITYLVNTVDIGCTGNNLISSETQSTVGRGGGSTNLGQNDSRMTIVLAPNPARGETRLTLTSPIAVNYVRATLRDLTGRLVQPVYEGTLEQNKSISLPISTAGLTPGVYLLESTTGKDRQVQRLIVE